MSQSPSKYLHIRNINGRKPKFIAFKILENAGNGDCLFTSIMQFLEHNGNYELPQNETDLRHKIVDYVSHSSNWNRFVDTIIFNLESLLPTLRKESYSDSCKRRIYSRYMSQKGQYGTFSELQAAAELFNFVYVVFRKEERRFGENEGNDDARYNCYRSEEDHKRKSKMFLFFSGRPSSGHFQFMKPILPKNEFVVPQGEYKPLDKYLASDNSYKILIVQKVTEGT